MDWDRLTFTEILAASKLMEMLGDKEDIEWIGGNIRILEAVLTFYRRELGELQRGEHT